MGTPATKYNQMKRADKLIISICFVLLAVAVSGIATTSIDLFYSMLNGLSPWIYILGLSYLILLVWTLYSGINKSRIAALLGVGAVTLSVPLLAGMEFYAKGTDSMRHAGHLTDVNATGVLPTQLYAALHALTATVMQVTGSGRFASMTIVSLGGFVAFVCGSYLLARQWDSSVRGLILITPFLLPFGIPRDTGNYTYFKPFLIAMFIAVFTISVFYYRQRGTSEFRWLWVALAATLGLLHPLAMISLFVALVGAWLLNNIERSNDLSVSTSGLVLIALVTGAWFVFSDVLSAPIYRLYVLISSPMEFLESMALFNSYTETATEQASQSGPGLLDIAFPRFVAIGLFSALGALCLLIVIGWWIRYYDYNDRDDALLWAKSKPIVVWVFLGGVFMIVNAVANVLPLLPLRPLAMFLPVAGVLFAAVASLEPRTKRVFLAIFLIISPFGLLTLYADPVTYQPNHQVGEGEVKSTEWYINSSDPDVAEATLMTSFSRYGRYTAGTSTGDQYGYSGRVTDLAPEYGLTTTRLNISDGSYYYLFKFDEWYVTGYRPSSGNERYVETPPRDKSLLKIYSSNQATIYQKKNLTRHFPYDQ